jgi:hypothetical protein
MNSINVNIKTIDIKTGLRKLNSKWTAEMSSDLIYHSGFGNDLERQLIIAIRKEKRVKTIKNLLNNI